MHAIVAKSDERKSEWGFHEAAAVSGPGFLAGKMEKGLERLARAGNGNKREYDTCRRGGNISR